MKKCKANYIKILAAMRDNCREVADIWEADGDKESAEKQRHEAIGFQAAIWLLSDYDNSFEDYGKIYFPEEFEEKNK